MLQASTYNESAFKMTNAPTVDVEGREGEQPTPYDDRINQTSRSFQAIWCVSPVRSAVARANIARLISSTNLAQTFRCRTYARKLPNAFTREKCTICTCGAAGLIDAVKFNSSGRACR